MDRNSEGEKLRDARRYGCASAGLESIGTAFLRSELERIRIANPRRGSKARKSKGTVLEDTARDHAKRILLVLHDVGCARRLFVEIKTLVLEHGVPVLFPAGPLPWTVCGGVLPSLGVCGRDVVRLEDCPGVHRRPAARHPRRSGHGGLVMALGIRRANRISAIITAAAACGAIEFQG